MATLDNSILSELIKRASTPLQYQPSNIQQPQQVQPVQQAQPLQPYTHSFDNKQVMRNGIQYNGTHNMTFGNAQTAQRLDSGIAKDPQYSRQEAPMQQHQGQGQYQGQNRSIGVNHALGYNNNPLLQSVINQSENVMQRTAIPIGNRKNAMDMLTQVLDYNSKQQGLDDQRAYQNSMIGVQQEQNRINQQQNNYNAIESQAKANYYNGIGRGATNSSSTANQTQKNNIDMMQMRRKGIEDVIIKSPDWDNKSPNVQAMIREEYTRSGRLPHRYITDVGGVERPLYYKVNASQYGDKQPQQQQVQPQQQQSQSGSRYVTYQNPLFLNTTKS